jgi:hypothetical protein
MAGIPARKKDTHGVTLQFGQILLKRIPSKGIDVPQAFRVNKNPVCAIPIFL